MWKSTVRQRSISFSQRGALRIMVTPAANEIFHASSLRFPTSSSEVLRITRRSVAVGSRQRSLSSAASSDGDPHALFRQQMSELREERESLFGFTEEEKDAWTNSSGHVHDKSLLDTIQEARDDLTSNNETGLSKSISTDRLIDHDLSWRYSADNTMIATESNRLRPHLHANEQYQDEHIKSTLRLTHLTEDSRSVTMVDVGSKQATQRVAVAQSRVVFPPEVAQALTTTASGSAELVGPKGPIFATAKLAGIMAAKKTSDLIPLCHPLPLDKVDISIDMIDDSVAIIRCECRVTHKTGVEMEALVGASITALTIYDMVKAISHRVRIEDTVLLSKAGGKRNVAESKEFNSSD